MQDADVTESTKLTKFLPGFCSIIFNASIAADASIGGNDAEKQYPAPESLCKRKNLTTDQELLWVFYHPPLNYLFIQCRSTIMHCGILNIFTKTIMRLIYPSKFYINIVSNFSWVLHSEYWIFSPRQQCALFTPQNFTYTLFPISPGYYIRNIEHFHLDNNAPYLSPRNFT